MADPQWTTEQVLRLLDVLERRTAEGAVEWETRGDNDQARVVTLDGGGVILMQNPEEFLLGVFGADLVVQQTWGYGPQRRNGPEEIGEAARRLWDEITRPPNLVLELIDELEEL